ncbi:MAG: hypothetical protein KDB80_05875, partial [Planctomycetes bacterium]|nr:hypothetical protein [Planctomycetota bacterium]
MNPIPPDPKTIESVADHGREIEWRLGALLDRVRRRFLVHGLGWMLAAITAGLVVYFALDRLLDLPALVRVVLSIGLVTFLAFGLRRRIVYPLRRAIAREDIAIALERR